MRALDARIMAAVAKKKADDKLKAKSGSVDSRSVMAIPASNQCDSVRVGALCGTGNNIDNSDEERKEATGETARDVRDGGDHVLTGERHVGF